MKPSSSVDWRDDLTYIIHFYKIKKNNIKTTNKSDKNKDWMCKL